VVIAAHGIQDNAHHILSIQVETGIKRLILEFKPS
jgi:hypothetical protein